MKENLKASTIKNLSFLIIPDESIGDVISGSCNNGVSKTSIHYNLSNQYAELECRKYSTVYPIYTGSGYVTGKLLLTSIVENFRIKGLDITTSKDNPLKIRTYTVSIEVAKLFESLSHIVNMVKGETSDIDIDTMLLNFTKIGIIFPYGGSRDYPITTSEFLEKAKKTILSFEGIYDWDLDAVSMNTLMEICVRVLMLIFGFAMIPIISIEVHEVLTSIILTDDVNSPFKMAEHPEHHIFSKVLYGFELFDSIESILTMNSKDPMFVANLKQLMYDPYNNKYTGKTLVNYSGKNNTAYLISKREFHKKNALSYSVFSYDQLSRNKTYENRGDMSIKKLMDPPVFIYKYGDKLIKYKDIPTAVINIYTNTSAIPSEFKRPPAVSIKTTLREGVIVTANDIASALITQFVEMDSVIQRMSIENRRKGCTSSLASIVEWSINLTVMDKLNSMKTSERKLQAVLSACVSSSIDTTLNSNVDASLERKVLSIIDSKSFIPTRFKESRSLKNLLIDCGEYYSNKKEPVASSDLSSIVNVVIVHISALLRSPVAATLLPKHLSRITEAVTSLLGRDASVIKYKRKTIRVDLYNKSEYYLIQGFGVGIFPCPFVGPGNLKIKDLATYLTYNILNASTNPVMPK
ncbi:MAG: hypothetical protein ACRCXX_05155 [Cetobacterium sp.]|uniref:hypothetical protein n=1 Tax=Cetobacterium sp. TaxID=2071632 RepID=UPI003F33C450